MRQVTKWIYPVLFAVVSCTAGRNEDLTLHFDRPAVYFEEALPMGNGRLGAMLYGGTSEEVFTLNDITLWSGEPDRGDDHIDIRTGIGSEAAATLPLVRAALEREDYAEADRLQRKIQGHYSESYQPLGTLRIRHADETPVEGYRRALDLSTATATTTYERAGKAFRETCFASAPDSVIVIHLAQEGGLHARIAYEVPGGHADLSVRDGAIVADGYTAFHRYPGNHVPKDGQVAVYDPERGMHFRTIVSVIPVGVKSVSRGAFCGIPVSHIRIPRSVEHIEREAFSGLKSCTAITVAPGNPVFSSPEGSNALMETASMTLRLGCQNTVIPAGTKRIGDYAFHEGKLPVGLNIPEGVTEIGEEAFWRSEGLWYLLLPRSLKKIGDAAFASCHTLEGIVVQGNADDIELGWWVFRGTPCAEHDFIKKWEEKKAPRMWYEKTE